MFRFEGVRKAGLFLDWIDFHTASARIGVTFVGRESQNRSPSLPVLTFLGTAELLCNDIARPGASIALRPVQRRSSILVTADYLLRSERCLVMDQSKRPTTRRRSKGAARDILLDRRPTAVLRNTSPCPSGMVGGRA